MEQLHLADDGKHLAYVTNEDGIGQLHVLALPRTREVSAAGAADRRDRRHRVLAGRQAAGARPSTARPRPAMCTWSTSPAPTLTRWTQSEVGGLDTSKFVTPTLVRFPDLRPGRRQAAHHPGLLLPPANGLKAGKVPVVINIHGGPEGAGAADLQPHHAVPWSTNWAWRCWCRTCAAPAGYGKTYLKLDNGDKREDSVKDIGALLDWIAKQPELDASRVGVIGGSYGGYMVLASLVALQRPHPRRHRRGRHLALRHLPEEHRELPPRPAPRRSTATSAIRRCGASSSASRRSNNAAAITTPLFVAQGCNDPRVPYTEAEQIVKAVRGNGSDGLVPDVQRRRPRLPQEDQQRLLRRRRHAVLEEIPARKMSIQK